MGGANTATPKTGSRRLRLRRSPTRLGACFPEAPEGNRFATSVVGADTSAKLPAFVMKLSEKRRGALVSTPWTWLTAPRLRTGTTAPPKHPTFGNLAKRRPVGRRSKRAASTALNFNHQGEYCYVLSGALY